MIEKIENSIEEYKRELIILEYKLTVATSLIFESEVLKIQNDIVWIKEIIDCLNKIRNTANDEF